LDNFLVATVKRWLNIRYIIPSELYVLVYVLAHIVGVYRWAGHLERAVGADIKAAAGAKEAWVSHMNVPPVGHVVR
jgi:hypothetical protein